MSSIFGGSFKVPDKITQGEPGSILSEKEAAEIPGRARYSHSHRHGYWRRGLYREASTVNINTKQHVHRRKPHETGREVTPKSWRQ